MASSLHSRLNSTARSAVAVEDPAVARKHKTKWTYFFLLVFTLLLFARPEDYFPFLNDFHLALVVSILAGASYIFSLFSRKVPFVWTNELTLVLALTAWFVIGMPFAHWRSHALEAFEQFWLKTLFIFFLLTQTLVSLKRIRQVVWLIIICAFVVSLLSLTLKGSELVKNADADRLSGISLGFLSGNYLGIAAGMLLPYIIVFLFRRRSTSKTIFLCATFGLVTWTLILTASRSGIIVLVASALLSWLVVLKKGVASRAFAIVLILSLAGAIWLAPKVFWERLGTLWGKSKTEIAFSAQESSELRSQALRNSFIFTMQHPIFGLGMGNFGIVNGEVTGNPYAWIGTHNMFTQVSSEGGLLALFIFGAMLFHTLREMFKISRKKTDDPKKSELVELAGATLVATIAFIVGGFFAHVAYDYYLYYLLAVSVCLQVLSRKKRILKSKTATANAARSRFASPHSSLALR